MKALWVHILSVASLSVSAQEPWIWTQYMFDLGQANVAYSGNADALFAAVRHRSQWTGWEGAPETGQFTLQAPMAGGKLGTGITLSAEQIGAHRETGADAAFSYKINLDKAKLSFGLSAGVSRRVFATEDITAQDPDEPLFANRVTGNAVIRFGAGTILTANRWFVGADVRNINRPYRSLGGYYSDPDPRECRGVAGAVMAVSERLDIRPSCMLRLREGGKPSAEVTVSAFWAEKIWLGLSHRIGYGFAAMADWSASRRLRIGYSTDLAVGRVGFLPPAHELFAGYYFNLGANRPPSIRYF